MRYRPTDKLVADYMTNQLNGSKGKNFNNSLSTCQQLQQGWQVEH